MIPPRHPVCILLERLEFEDYCLEIKLAILPSISILVVAMVVLWIVGYVLIRATFVVFDPYGDHDTGELAGWRVLCDCRPHRRIKYYT